MSHLPDDRPATRRDVADLRSEIGEVRSYLHTGFREFRAEIREDLRHIQRLPWPPRPEPTWRPRSSAVTVAGLVFIAAQIV